MIASTGLENDCNTGPGSPSGSHVQTGTTIDPRIQTGSPGEVRLQTWEAGSRLWNASAVSATNAL